MDRFQLKNTIILILLLVNVFLLGSIAHRTSAEKDAYQNSIIQLESLFRGDGISLDTDEIPRELPPAGVTLTRSISLDTQAAAFLLGDDLSSADQGGGIYTYSGSRGAALFRSNGSFDAAGTLSGAEAGDFCREFCRKFGYEEPVLQLDDRGNGTATALRRWDGLTVFNCSVTFTFSEGAVISATGTLLPEQSAAAAAGPEPLSALAALTAFQQTRRETGAVVTSVSSVSLCYELQSTTTVPLSLVPAWCISTNTAKYYVNCITGAVSLF